MGNGVEVAVVSKICTVRTFAHPEECASQPHIFSRTIVIQIQISQSRCPHTFDTSFNIILSSELKSLRWPFPFQRFSAEKAKIF